MKNSFLPQVLWRHQNTPEHGYIERRRGRSIVIYAADIGTDEAIQKLQDFANVFRERYPRNHIVFVAKDACEQTRMAEQFPEDRIVLQPLSVGDAHGRLIFRLRTQLLLFFGIPDTDMTRWLEQAGKTGAAVAMIEDGKDDHWRQALSATIDQSLLTAVKLFIVKDRRSHEGLGATGVSEDRLYMVDATHVDPTKQCQLLIDRMAAILSVKRLPEKYWARKKPSIKKLKKFTIGGSIGQYLVRWNHRLIESVADLRDELGPFRSILCLGNGPSSEDPRLSAVNYDQLFRVNHRWINRGLFDRPDMIFTGNRSTIKAAGSHIVYGLQNIEAEHRLAHALFPSLHRYTLVTMERLGLYDFEAFSTYRPTNGAVMLAMAVALAPKRLIIGGIDLFDHPKGCYPDQDDIPNAYTLIHDRDTELRYILKVLDGYDGDLVILSDVLADHWKTHKGTGLSTSSSEPANIANLR